MDHVLPDVPLRQFVVTMPFPLRFPLAFDGKLLEPSCFKRPFSFTFTESLGIGGESQRVADNPPRNTSRIQATMSAPDEPCPTPMSAKQHGRQAAVQAASSTIYDRTFCMQMRFGEEKMALVPTMHRTLKPWESRSPRAPPTRSRTPRRCQAGPADAQKNSSKRLWAPEGEGSR